MSGKKTSRTKKGSKKSGSKVVDISTRLSRPPEEEGVSDKSAAQDLIYDAWETSVRKKRVEIAEKALELWPDCADAYMIFVKDKARTIKEAVGYCEEGVKAGERALGKKGFKEYEGHFWGFLETRPYMRARAGLASMLILSGEKEKAAQHYREMLVLNPGDNQGVRYELAALLVELGRDQELEDLLAENVDDGAAAFTYSRALLTFRREGDSSLSRDSLAEAFKSNPHVPEYLLVRKKLPKQLPETYGYGDESEAVEFTYTFQLGWAMTEGALDWMKTQDERFTPDESRTGQEPSEVDEPDMELLRASMHEVVRNQMDELSPPETKETYDRLRSEGYSDEEAVHLIGSIVWVEMHEVMLEKRPFDEKKYIRFLRRLPKVPDDY